MKKHGAACGDHPSDVAENPLDHIVREHLEQREICAALDRLADLPEANPDAALDLLQLMRDVLPRHVRDEEEDLFPLIRERAEGDEDLPRTLDRLTNQHEGCLAGHYHVLDILERMIAQNRRATAEEAHDIRAMTDHERRHLIVENAIVIPLARALLDQGDLDALRSRMIARRAGPHFQKGR